MRTEQSVRQNRVVMDSRHGFGSAVFSPHAVAEMARRRISEADVRAVLSDPDRRAAVRPGRIVLTSLEDPGAGGREYVVRVVVDIDRSPPVIVTAYRSSKIGKYWSQH